MSILISSANSNLMPPWAMAVWGVWQRASWNQCPPLAYPRMVTAFVMTTVYSAKASKMARKWNTQKTGSVLAIRGNSCAVKPVMKSALAARWKFPPNGMVQPLQYGIRPKWCVRLPTTRPWSAGVVKVSIPCVCGAHAQPPKSNWIFSTAAIMRVRCLNPTVRKVFRAFCIQRTPAQQGKSCACGKSFSSPVRLCKTSCAVICNNTAH